MKNHCFTILLVTLFLVSACGKHEQSLERVIPKSSIADTSETNQKLILINAINSGDLDKVKSSLTQVGDINAYSNEGLTLIMVALQAQQFAVVEYLVNQGADLSLKTMSTKINPDQSAAEFFSELPMDGEIKAALMAILNKENFEIAKLNEFIFSSITFKNVSLIEWLLSKGADPNTIRKSGSGKEKDSPLIYLFSLRGVKGEEFVKLNKIFQLLVSQPAINVNLKVKGDTPLSKALKRLEDDGQYKPLVDKLKSMGAH